MTRLNLERFLRITQQEYEVAFSEITNGKKKTHWMWYIFPQMAGLGSSDMSAHYAIRDLSEAELFLKDRILSIRIIAVCNAVIMHESKTIIEIFGIADAKKLQSSMTLFSLASNASPVFQLVLDLFFNGEKDLKTLETIYANS